MSSPTGNATMGRMSGRRVTLNGRTRVPGGHLAHQVRGRLEAPALLLLQGQANSHRWWDGVRPLLAQRFLTITFDYRGTGGSADLAPDGAGWSTRLFADDAAAVLAALGRTDVLVYGTSMGGRIAQELAINHAGRVRRLVLACTSPGGSLGHERGREVRLALADADPIARFRTMVDLFYTPRWTRAHGGYRRVPMRLLGDRSMSAAAANRHLLVSAGHDAADRLHRIQAPTLILHGDDDRMVPTANAAILGERIPGSEVRLLPGRHGFFDELAEPVTRTVADFLMADG